MIAACVVLGIALAVRKHVKKKSKFWRAVDLIALLAGGVLVAFAHEYIEFARILVFAACGIFGLIYALFVRPSRPRALTERADKAVAEWSRGQK